MAHMSGIKETLGSLFDAERAARELHDELARAPRAELVRELGDAARDAVARASSDEAEASLRLARVAALLGDLDGDDVVDLLVDILGGPSAEARITAGEALEALAFDRWKEVALGIERAVARLPKGSPALTELPFLLAEVGEPGCVKLLGRFLAHADADAVAAAIEASAELGDPAAIPLLAPLEKDGRQVQLDDEDAGSDRVAIGDLAHEARELLENVQHELDADAKKAQPGPKNKPRGGRH
jgi:hypothetical protein